MEQSDEHPFYWEQEGEPVLLLGATDDDNLFQWPKEKRVDHLDELVEAGGNYVRNTMSDRQDRGFELFPFKQVGEGTYDLAQWNPEYWGRFKTFLQETAARGIVVQIEMWDPWDAADNPFGEGNYWASNPYNPRNNVNYTMQETGIPEEWEHSPMSSDHPVYLAAPPLDDIPQVFEFQQAFVRKVMETSLQHDHVLYTVCNERMLPKEFSTFWGRRMRDIAETQGKDIFLSDMYVDETAEPVLRRPEIFDFAELSQGGEHAGEDHYEALLGEKERLAEQPAPMNIVKQYGSDAEQGDWFGDAREVQRKFWRAIFAGCASFRFHRPTFGIGLCSASKQMMRAARMLADRVTVPAFEPATELLSGREVDEAYAMRDGNGRTLVYFTGGGAVSLDSSVTGKVDWLDVDGCEWSEEEQAAADSRLTTPGSGQWMAVIS